MCRSRDILIAACGVAACIAWPGSARAHRLETEFRVLPGKRVQIEAWYDITSEPAKDAKVMVFQGAGVLTEGTTNENGVWVFPFEKAEELRIVVDAGAGHRKELRILAAALGRDLKNDALVDRGTRISVKDVLLGVTFVLAAAAFILSVRNARRLTPPTDGPRT